MWPVDASGTFSETTRQAGLLRMLFIDGCRCRCKRIGFRVNL